MKIILTAILLLLYYNSLSVFDSIQNHSIDNPLPDILPLTLYAWWGPFNTTSIGVFLYYEIINNGATIYSHTPISINISFYAADEIIGYITQHTLLFPNIWYSGEKLGGSIFFKLTSKPYDIRMIVDHNNSIYEENEDNNEIDTDVSIGVTIEGYILQDGKRCKEKIEIYQVDNNSLLYNGFRRYYTNETGFYIATLPPISNSSYRYTLVAYSLINKTSNLKISPPVKPGETVILNFTFNKPPARPFKPFTIPVTKVGRKHMFFITGRYRFKVDWGDKTYSKWVTSKIIHHIWRETGLYHIKTIFIDDNGMLSKWSKPINIIVISE